MSKPKKGSRERRGSIHCDFLQLVPLISVCDPDQKVNTVNIKASLEDTFKQLNACKVSQLPVINDNGEYEYIVSRLDIISMLAWSNHIDESWKKSPLIDVLDSEDHAVDVKVFKFPGLCVYT